MPPLTAQSIQTGRDQMPFLAFGGTQKPRDYVAEYQSGSKELFNVDNTYGSNAKGEYDFLYGLVWNGENQIYDPTHRQANKQMMNMTKSAKSAESLESPKPTHFPDTAKAMKENEVGAQISKDGKVMCTPGYVLKNNVCVLEPTIPVCQPGWRKVNGVCIKDPRELEKGGMPMGSMGTAQAATEYPLSKPGVLSMNRLRAYVQERNTVEKNSMSPGTVNIIAFLIVIGIVTIIIMGTRIKRF